MTVHKFYMGGSRTTVDLMVSRVGPKWSTSNSNSCAILQIRDTINTTVAATGIEIIKNAQSKLQSYFGNGSVVPWTPI